MMSKPATPWPASLKALWADTLANHARLDSCPRHDFAPAEPKSRQRVCKNCGGSLNSIEARWYERGIAHATGANEDDWK